MEEHSSNTTQKYVYIETLGCKTNQYESEAIAAMFAARGYTPTEENELADVCIINTCTVTHVSDRKSRQSIRRVAGNKKPGAIVAVCGCYAQVAHEEVANLGEADIIIGTNKRSEIVEAVEKYLLDGNKTVYLAGESELKEYEQLGESRIVGMTRAYLKIQEGCRQFCSYCIIPYARGPLRSRKMADILHEAANLEREGFKEIILTGTHLGAYGLEAGSEGYDLADVCAEILKHSQIARLRIGSLEPMEVSDKLLELMRDNPRMCHHLHLPLQSGEDSVLARMNRPYNTAQYREIIQKVRAHVPDIAITTDFIVGFPGESDDDFRQSLMFCDEMSFAAMHIFKYSPRAHTPAATFSGQIDSQIKDKRSKAMAAVAEKHSLRFMQSFVGQRLEVLLEEQDKKGYWEGHTGNYLKVLCSLDGEKGALKQIIITELNKHSLYGREV